MGKQIRRGKTLVEWSPKMIKELNKLYFTNSQKELAEHFGCTLSALKGAVTRYGVEKKRERGWTAKDDGYLLKNWDAYTKDDLAARFGKTRSAVIRRYNKLKRIG